MTQRIFDVENEKDMADLWGIIPESIIKIRKAYKSKDGYYCNYYDNMEGFYESDFLLINWHDKTEITRPIQEATKADIDKICCFWDSEYNPNAKIVGCLHSILPHKDVKYVARGGLSYRHCRRLTKQEAEELI